MLSSWVANIPPRVESGKITACCLILKGTICLLFMVPVLVSKMGLKCIKQRFSHYVIPFRLVINILE